VRWPDEERLSAKRPAGAKRKLGYMTMRALSRDGSATRSGRARGAVSAEPQ